MKKFFFLACIILIFAGCSSDDDNVNSGERPEAGDPVAVDDAVTASENEELNIEKDFLLENDELVDSSRISSFDTETTEGGEVVDNRDGTLSYFPPEDFQGEDNFSYQLCVPGSEGSRCATATVIITVGDAGAPVAQDDTYETEEGDELSIINHLSNDTLLDNADITAINTEDTNGTAVLEEDGSIIYTPAEGFSGEDSFTYTVCDNDQEPECATATITVNVIDEGSPVANDDTVVVDAGNSGFAINNLLNNDDPIDGAVLSSIDASSSQGNVTLNDDGIITYEPVAGFTGEDSFTYTICDDDQEPTCATATVNITVIEPVGFDIPSELEDYYEQVVFSQNEDLNYHVASEITVGQHTTILSYGERHNYLYDADEDPDNPENVILMYSGESRYWEEYTSGNNSYTPQTFNTEHIYPQSRLDAANAVTDLHHLRSADASINSLRLNYPYSEGSGEYGLVGESAWYPGDEWIGDVARMVMYLNIRYGEEFDEVGGLDLLLKWNRMDPVSELEIQRNNVIASAQGNRNPFIDNPYLATLIWGGDAAENRWE
ncbi:Ig-like domain-containing protein [Zunongwangia sp. F260]|uniref:Ig-like domain-containing protein n=1 Tax=Autumnicola lenta TaxID=3075593 RepID=A0ABU3CGZ0_9FLAO|nr:Ig-like domain-containing protein [Zunongwangia sp. F260]MDT0645619.1 Ig-like domain-containing protein [Zunongwangia sp. F260]